MQGSAEKVSTINDQEEFADLLQAFKKLDFGDEEVNVRYHCVSSAISSVDDVSCDVAGAVFSGGGSGPLRGAAV